MSAIINIIEYKYAFESFISLLNVLGLLWLDVLVFMYCYINFEEKKNGRINLCFVTTRIQLINT